ncbi:MAG: glycosyltransferase family 4 protein [Terracidiphilus sp.]
MQESQNSFEAAAVPGAIPSRARIIVVSQFFGQDQSAVGQFLADFAKGAAEAGHDVRVICGASEYAAGDAVAGSRPEEPPTGNRECPAGCGKVSVTRVRTATFSQSRTRRLVSYATFYAGAAWRALSVPEPNAIVTLTAPPGLSWIGWLIQRIRGCRHIAWEMDLYPDIAIALGIPVARWTVAFLDFPRRRADAVIALGECMKARLLRHRIPANRIVVAENWADGTIVSPQPFPEPRPLRILYSGNLGLAHDVATIREVMERLAGRPDLLFLFAGGGLERRKLDAFCRERGISNVSFTGYARLQELGASLAESHVGLVTQKTETLGAVVPSKIYGLMAAARPVLYIGPAAATPALLIRRYDCGWQFECGDVDGVSALLLRLLEEPDEIRRKGRNGRAAFEANYDKPAGVGRVIRALGLDAAR